MLTKKARLTPTLISLLLISLDVIKVNIYKAPNTTPKVRALSILLVSKTKYISSILNL